MYVNGYLLTLSKRLELQEQKTRGLEYTLSEALNPLWDVAIEHGDGVRTQQERTCRVRIRESKVKERQVQKQMLEAFDPCI